MSLEVDYEGIEAFLVGYCGKDIKAAMLVGAQEFDYLRKAYQQRERSEWERLRWLSFNIMNLSPFIKEGQRPRTPEKYLPFSWDQKPKSKGRKQKAKPLTAQQIEVLNLMITAHEQRKRFKS